MQIDTFTSLLVAGLTLLVHATGVLNAFHAALHARTSQGAIAWVMALLLFPWVAIPLYWVFGPRRFRSYARRVGEAQRSHRVRIKEHLALLDEFRAPLRDEATQRFFERLAELPFTGGNLIELHTDAPEAFRSMFEAIEQAEHYVLVQFYIFRDDDIGRRFAELLKRKAKQGVRVLVLADAIGSYTLPSSYGADLCASGVDYREFRTGRGIRNRFQVNFRNHRKIVVVDGRIGYTGGFNIGDEYLGRDPYFGQWRDANIRLEGPAVQGLQLSFAKDWFWQSGRLPELNWRPLIHDDSADGLAVALPVASGPADDAETALLYVLGLIERARSRLWIASPYFVPDEAIFAALQAAAMRGVDVRLLIPDRADHTLVYVAREAYIKATLESGVRVFEYTPGFMHQKVILVDDDAVSVGSVNLDNRSLRLNFELSVLVLDKALADCAAESLERDFAASKEQGMENWLDRPLLRRTAAAACRLFSPIL